MDCQLYAENKHLCQSFQPRQFEQYIWVKCANIFVLKNSCNSRWQPFYARKYTLGRIIFTNRFYFFLAISLELLLISTNCLYVIQDIQDSVLFYPSQSHLEQCTNILFYNYLVGIFIQPRYSKILTSRHSWLNYSDHPKTTILSVMPNTYKLL